MLALAMGTQRSSRRVGIGVTFGLALVCALAAATSVHGNATSTSRACAGAADLPTAAGLQAASAAVVCLVNAQRTKRSIPALRVSRRLARAALAHSADMVRRGYFSHVSPDGGTPRLRVKRAGYIRKVKDGKINETLATGVGERGTAAELVARLLSDGPHRRILLSREYRDLGVGFVLGSAIAEPPDASTTLTINFGRR